MSKGQQYFGGKWTKEKLSLLGKYLTAYTKIMNNQNFEFAYIDAFAGTGYYQRQRKPAQSALMPEFGIEEKEFLEGSPRMALSINPPFKKYIFIEKDKSRYEELKKLKVDFPDLQNRITVTNAEANTYLLEVCRKNWRRHRAVVFLDPFGMEVRWKTIEAIALTHAIDLWLLFPLGQAINRLLRKDGRINPSNRERLNEIFGSDDWYEYFYKEHQQLTLLNEGMASVKKIADFKIITQYFINRLKTIFADVSRIPRPLYNSRNVPLFLLCFAAGNKKGAPLAIKIADDILRTT